MQRRKFSREFKLEAVKLNQAKAERFDYIERFYNPPRRHSTLGCLSPIEFGRQAQVA